MENDGMKINDSTSYFINTLFDGFAERVSSSTSRERDPRSIIRSKNTIPNISYTFVDSEPKTYWFCDDSNSFFFFVRKRVFAQKTCSTLCGVTFKLYLAGAPLDAFFDFPCGGFPNQPMIVDTRLFRTTPKSPFDRLT